MQLTDLKTRFASQDAELKAAQVALAKHTGKNSTNNGTPLLFNLDGIQRVADYLQAMQELMENPHSKIERERGVQVKALLTQTDQTI